MKSSYSLLKNMQSKTMVKDQVAPGTTIETIEGNTNSKGTRDSNTGDGVWRKRRSVSSIRSLIRILT